MTRHEELDDEHISRDTNPPKQQGRNVVKMEDSGVGI